MRRFSTMIFLAVLQLHLQASTWKSRQSWWPSLISRKIITTLHTRSTCPPHSVNIYVCLARLHPTDTSVPFISSLELRPLDTATKYTVVQTAGVYMTCIFHVYLGNWTQNVIRYPYDKYDSLWLPAFSKGFDETEATYITTTSHLGLWIWFQR